MFKLKGRFSVHMSGAMAKEKRKKYIKG